MLSLDAAPGRCHQRERSSPTPCAIAETALNAQTSGLCMRETHGGKVDRLIRISAAFKRPIAAGDTCRAYLPVLRDIFQMAKKPTLHGRRRGPRPIQAWTVSTKLSRSRIDLANRSRCTVTGPDCLVEGVCPASLLAARDIPALPRCSLEEPTWPPSPSRRPSLIAPGPRLLAVPRKEHRLLIM